MRISDWSSDVCSSDLYVNRNSHLHKSTDLSIIRCMPSALPDRPPQQERSRRTHARLLEATLKTLAEHGLDGATIPRIARVADVSPATVYRRFVDKQALLRAARSEEHTSELQSLMRLSYAVFCLK